MRLLLSLLILLLVGSCKPGVARHGIHGKDTLLIAVVPLGGFSSDLAKKACAELSSFYGVKTKLLQARPEFEAARLKGTQRYSASQILNLMKAEIPAGCDRLLALTSSDIFTSKMVNGYENPYWGIFGLGYQPGRVCVVSDFRLKKFRKQHDELLVNVVLHESGHNYGLAHCNRDTACLMNDARGTIKTLFRERKWLCPACRKQVELGRGS